MKCLTAFSCYVADDILVKPKRRLDINVEDKSHLVYDTKYNTARTATRTATRTAARIAQEVLMGFAISESAGARELSGTGLNP